MSAGTATSGAGSARSRSCGPGKTAGSGLSPPGTWTRVSVLRRAICETCCATGVCCEGRGLGVGASPIGVAAIGATSTCGTADGFACAAAHSGVPMRGDRRLGAGAGRSPHRCAGRGDGGCHTGGPSATAQPAAAASRRGHGAAGRNGRLGRRTAGQCAPGGRIRRRSDGSSRCGWCFAAVGGGSGATRCSRGGGSAYGRPTIGDAVTLGAARGVLGPGSNAWASDCHADAHGAARHR